MPDLLGLLAILAVYLVPILAFWWLYRRYLGWRERRRRAMTNPGEPTSVATGGVQPEGSAAAAVAPDGAAPAASREGPDPVAHRMSFPIAAPLVIYPLLLWGAVRGWQHWWGYLFDAVYLGLVGLLSWEALSRREFAAAAAKDPTLNRLTWVVNWLVPWVVLPLGLALVALVMLLGGARAGSGAG